MKQNRVSKIVAALGLGVLLLLISQLALGTGLANLMRKRLPTHTPSETRFQDSFIRAEDLPLGWHRDRIGIRTKEMPGTEARSLAFYGTWDSDKTWIKIRQELILYPSPEAASIAYEKQSMDYTESWVTPPELEFNSQANQMYAVCLPGYINGLHHYTCEAVGLYGDIVAILQGNVFDDRWLTMEDFKAVLEAMDRRIVAAAEDQVQ